MSPPNQPPDRQTAQQHDLAQVIRDLTGSALSDPAIFELGPGIAYVIELPSRAIRYVSPIGEAFPNAFSNVLESCRTWDELVFADDRDLFKSTWAHLESSEQATTHHYRARASRRGGSLPIEDHRLALRDLSGKVVGAIGRLVDDSFRSAAMDSLARRSWKEIASAMTRRFLHDFNNTIAGIYSLSELYAEPGSDPKSMAEAMGYIRDNSIRAQDLTAKIRQLTTLEPGEASLHNLETLARDQEDYIKALLPKGSEIHYESSQKEIPVRLDSNSFRQAILHLACNTREATDNEATIAIRCRTVRASDGSMVAKLAFEDNGSGIKSSVLPKVLEPFFSTKDDHSGLGLNIVQTFMREIGGTLAIESEPGSGTRVTLTFPIPQFESSKPAAKPVATTRATPVAAEPPAPPPPAVKPPDAKPCVLIYAWEDVSRHPLMRAIAEAGWSHTLHQDASQALLDASYPEKPLKSLIIFKSSLDERVGPLVSELGRIRGAPPIALISLGESVDGMPETLKKSCGLIASGNQRPAHLLDQISQLFR